MAREYHFNTVRMVFVRNDDNKEDDEFYLDILADGVSTTKLTKEQRGEVGTFLAEFFKDFNKQAIGAYEASNHRKACGSGDV
jgi:hypothetical protein